MSHNDNNHSNRHGSPRAPQQQPYNASAVVIEEEQPHEFYADLVSSKVVVVQQPSSVSSSRVLSSSLSSNTHVIVPTPTCFDTPINNDNTNKNPKSEFTQVYQRALQYVPKLSKLSLDSTNRGYQMLRKMGWKERHGGLGKHNQGTVVPVKRSKVKHNKEGLGIIRKNKTTKYMSCSSRAGSKLTNQDSSSNDQQQQQQQQTKRKKNYGNDDDAQEMKRIRMSLRTDISEEYEDLYLKLT